MIKRDVLDFINKLNGAEQGCDTALSSYAELLLSAQAVEGLKFGETQAVYSDIAEAMNLLLRGRFHLARAHAKSLEIAERRGLIPVGWGDTMPTTEKNRDAFPATIEPLRVAA
ncbi:hypothetical protein [Sphingomonas sp. Y38-1Y]|uniref:hypothetical protein n=1 Tax=Sphingomonas sp. Y38-1Y TaxID=3078265 RepID=UPI0028E45393|nr:hypothetical protein [Sphingomonas sp. Y38-1Y]